MSKAVSQRDSAVFAAERRNTTSWHVWSLLHVVTAGQKLPQLSLSSQYFFMIFTLVQLLCAGATILSRVAGENSVGLTVAARAMVFMAPLRADTEINPMVYYILFLLSVLWAVLTVLAVVYVTAKGTSLAR